MHAHTFPSLDRDFSTLVGPDTEKRGHLLHACHHGACTVVLQLSIGLTDQAELGNGKQRLLLPIWFLVPGQVMTLEYRYHQVFLGKWQHYLWQHLPGIELKIMTFINEENSS